tara:strand:- start:159 stop:1268 length:1110 start_codon:yes stop_codon:yes gene_type:complete
MSEDWYRITNEAEIPTPALLIYPDRVFRNLQRMVEIIGDKERLRPHVKTHKLPEIIGMHLSLGITRFKCATIAEAEMVASSGGRDVLLAHQPVGPNAVRLRFLADRYPKTHWSTVVDDISMVKVLSDVFANANNDLTVYLDLNCGMDRTGIVPGPEAKAIYEAIGNAPRLMQGGLHAYDGHNHEPDLGKRTAQCESDFKPVLDFRKQLVENGSEVPVLIASGTPTFPIHSRYTDRECSPGTTVLWDFGYDDGLPDLSFEYAAVLLTRVISKPGRNRVCLDLGHKAVAADKPQPRVRLFGTQSAKPLVHSEEHLTVEAENADELSVGDCCYGVPVHICPTVALHDIGWAVRDGRAGQSWEIAARRRSLGI